MITNKGSHAFLKNHPLRRSTKSFKISAYLTFSADATILSHFDPWKHVYPIIYEASIRAGLPVPLLKFMPVMEIMSVVINTSQSNILIFFPDVRFPGSRIQMNFFVCSPANWHYVPHDLKILLHPRVCRHCFGAVRAILHSQE